ncbi:hypothetical protein [Prosthecobacter vanneervenii]|uniref:Uncharacterized protein n=1 Tax=Prosthecobacter vanneervenii TaxID=48466 RepID=A0A7W7YDP3_9BACT|nr:hypothetical protein [Prosthecobacter vanneervenii]MBB5033960.1 hypothetical protein [Prosthecobacter vanneervenii]
MTLETAILDALARSELPLKAAEIAKLIKPTLGKAASPKAVAAALDALASTGPLTRILAGTAAKPQPFFTPQSPEAATAAYLKSWVQASAKEQSAAKLQTKLPLTLRPFFETALAQLVSSGEAFLQSGAKRLVYAHRPRPTQALTTAQRTALQKILLIVNGARSQPASLEELLAWLDQEPSSPPAPPSTSVIAPSEVELQAWYELDRIRSSTMMIPIPSTFARYQTWAAERGGMPDIQLFRRFIEKLYNDGRLLLEPCERPQDLPEHERALLVPMSLGPPGYSWCWLS